MKSACKLLSKFKLKPSPQLDPPPHTPNTPRKQVTETLHHYSRVNKHFVSGLSLSLAISKLAGNCIKLIILQACAQTRQTLWQHFRKSAKIFVLHANKVFVTGLKLGMVKCIHKHWSVAVCQYVYHIN